MSNSYSIINAFTVSVLVLTGLTSAAQEQRSTQSRADEHFARYEYALAAPMYQDLVMNKKINTSLMENLAFCYKALDQFSKAAYWYGRALPLPDAQSEDGLYYADMLKAQGKYTAAKSAYQQYAGKGLTNVINRIAGCDSALVWEGKPGLYRVTNMRGINTAFSDWGAVWYAKNQIVFTSDSLRSSVLDPAAAINPRGFGRTNQPFQKLYVVDTTSGYKGLGFIHGFAAAMNKDQYHIGPVSFTTSYDTAYFTITNPGKVSYNRQTGYDKKQRRVLYYGSRRLEIFMSIRDSSNQWQTPVAFAYNNTAAYSVGHAAISPDGTLLYFASDMPGGHGKTDIWFSEKQRDGSWGMPQNCGPSINTEDEEEFPTIGHDGTLYFSSKGHVGMGGFDIFKASGSRQQWTVPVNMHCPINSSEDDFYFEPRDSASGFFSSNRPGGAGEDDIYSYAMDSVPSGPAGRSVLVLETTVLEKQSGQPLADAWVCLTDSNRNDRWTQITSVDAKVYNILTPDHFYGDSAFKQGLISSGKTFNTNDMHMSDTIRITVYLDHGPLGGTMPPGILIPDSLRFSAVYYDFDKWAIRPDAAASLDRLILIMHQHPDLKIDLSSFTDARGSTSYNTVLSGRRAVSVKNYLEAHGIPADRIRSNGFGKTHLVNGCTTGVPCPEASHQLNRRTEVKLWQH